jgi:hypothetical protein
VATQLGDLLEEARRHSFVGRRRELAGFDDALAGCSRRVLFVHGQGGIGKSTLLGEFHARALAAGRVVAFIDGRDVDPSPDGLAAAVRHALDQEDDRRPITQLLAGGVLLVDGYEQLAGIDGWLRGEFLPGLSAGNVVVLAGRDPPTAPWQSDPGWRRLVAVHRLDTFDPAESGELLARAGVAPQAWAHLVTLGCGHPLTVALLADLAASGEVPGALADAPDLISALVESFLGDVPSEAHLIGLATCATAWLTTEELLAQMVGADATVVWQWLARRPFVTSTPRGLFAHDLVRDVLDAEFARRAPERHRAYRRAIRDHAVAGVRAATGLDRQLHGQQMLFMLRRTPLTGAMFAPRARGCAMVVPGRPDEHEQVCAIIERFEGSGSAELARAWLDEQPEQLSVVRAGDGVASFAYHVVSPSGSALEERDPIVRAILDHVAREGPIRPGEQVGIQRFAGSHGPNSDQYALLAISVRNITEWLTRPLAWSFLIDVGNGHWAPLLDYMAFAPLVEVTIGGRRRVAYGIDWRRLPVDDFLDLLVERGSSGGTGPPPAGLLRPPPLDRARFGAAVRVALQALHRPDQLAVSPLMGSALAATAGGPTAGQLRTTIDAAIACLGEEPKGDQLRAVLHRTYQRAAPTQEAAAEVLGLPLSTYRRYLARALDQLVDLLWTVEIGDLRLPGPSIAEREAAIGHPLATTSPAPSRSRWMR